MLPPLTTSRLSLQPVAASDLDALVRLWDNPRVRLYLFDNQPVTPESAAPILEACLHQAEIGLGMWNVQRLASPGLIGCAALLPVGVALQYDPALEGLIEPTIALHPDHWHRGYARECLRALLDYGFGAMGLERIAGVSDAPNEASHRMLAAVGFVQRFEGPGPYYAQRSYALNRAAYEEACRRLDGARI